MAEAKKIQKEEDQNSAEAGGQEIVVANRYRILAESPLSDLNLGDAKAYVTRDDKSPKELLFARIRPADAVPRLEILNNVKHLMDANLLRPVEGESVIWPGGVERRFTLVDRLGR
jgi:hypothetical protein